MFVTNGEKVNDFVTSQGFSTKIRWNVCRKLRKL